MIANGRGQLCKLFSSEISSEDGVICVFDRREGLDRKQSVERRGWRIERTTICDDALSASPAFVVTSEKPTYQDRSEVDSRL